MNTAAAGGWLAKAIGAGLRTTSRPGRFGSEVFIVKSTLSKPTAWITFTQSQDKALRFMEDSHTPGEQAIVDELVAIGILFRE